MNNDVSYIELCDNNGVQRVVIIGVHLPFDDNSATRLANYISNLEIIKSVIDEHVDIPVFIVGDFNTDLNLDKRYTRYLTRFIQDNNLKCIDYEFPNINYTFTNGTYTNHIDHVITNSLARNRTVECKIISDYLNMSDHNPILTSVIIDITSNLEISKSDRKYFYKFPWKEEGFIIDFQQSIREKLTNFEYKLDSNININDKSTYIENKFDELRKLLIQAARVADKNSKKQYIISKNK